MSARPSLADRLWKKVTKTDSCWLRKVGKGHRYSQIWHNKSNRHAHRLSWELHNGPIPEGMHVCHRCDNPACVRPDHLFLDTAAGNIEDKVSKKRQAVGERCALTKLTKEDVLQILEMFFVLGAEPPHIANFFNVSRTCIYSIINYQTWMHVTNSIYSSIRRDPAYYL